MAWISIKKIKDAYKVLTGEYEAVIGPLTYNQDGLTTRYNCDFMNEDRFLKSYSHKPSLRATHWRKYILCWAANRAVKMDGDFVECGVDRGDSALSVSKYVELQNLNKKFYLLDTFSGVEKKYILDTERAHEYPESYEFVKGSFQDYPNIEIIKGTIPDTLSLIKSEKISYCHIDMGYKIPELAAIEFLWKKMVVGGTIILNTYGWIHESVKSAHDDFALRNGVQVLPLPTGQGLLIKP